MAPLYAELRTGQRTRRHRVVLDASAAPDLNGEAAGYSPLDLKVSVGNHTVSASMPGRTDSVQKERVDMTQDGLEAVTFNF